MINFEASKISIKGPANGCRPFLGAACSVISPLFSTGFYKVSISSRLINGESTEIWVGNKTDVRCGLSFVNALRLQAFGPISRSKGGLVEPSGLESYYLSDLLARRLYSEAGQRLGKVSDLILDLERALPEVIGVVYRAGFSRLRRCVKWADVIDLPNSLIVVKKGFDGSTTLEKGALAQTEVLLRDFLLDKQIVDVHGAKVERVNDLKFVRSDGKLLLVQVDVGLRGLLRRLRFRRFSRTASTNGFLTII